MQINRGATGVVASLLLSLALPVKAQPAPAPAVGAISIAPADAKVAPDGTLRLSANVPVFWFAAAGSITQDGVFTPPVGAAIGSTIIVGAVSRADLTKGATVGVAIYQPAPVPAPAQPTPPAVTKDQSSLAPAYTPTELAGGSRVLANLASSITAFASLASLSSVVKAGEAKSVLKATSTLTAVTNYGAAALSIASMAIGATTKHRTNAQDYTIAIPLFGISLTGALDRGKLDATLADVQERASRVALQALVIGDLLKVVNTAKALRESAYGLAQDIEKAGDAATAEQMAEYSSRFVSLVQQVDGFYDIDVNAFLKVFDLPEGKAALAAIGGASELPADFSKAISDWKKARPVFLKQSMQSRNVMAYQVQFFR